MKIYRAITAVIIISISMLPSMAVSTPITTHPNDRVVLDEFFQYCMDIPYGIDYSSVMERIEDFSYNFGDYRQLSLQMRQCIIDNETYTDQTACIINAIDAGNQALNPTDPERMLLEYMKECMADNPDQIDEICLEYSMLGVYENGNPMLTDEYRDLSDAMMDCIMDGGDENEQLSCISNEIQSSGITSVQVQFDNCMSDGNLMAGCVNSSVVQAFMEDPALPYNTVYPARQNDNALYRIYTNDISLQSMMNFDLFTRFNRLFDPLLGTMGATAANYYTDMQSNLNPLDAEYLSQQEEMMTYTFFLPMLTINTDRTTFISIQYMDPETQCRMHEMDMIDNIQLPIYYYTQEIYPISSVRFSFGENDSGYNCLYGIELYNKEELFNDTPDTADNDIIDRLRFLFGDELARLEVQVNTNSMEQEFIYKCYLWFDKDVEPYIGVPRNRLIFIQGKPGMKGTHLSLIKIEFYIYEFYRQHEVDILEKEFFDVENVEEYYNSLHSDLLLTYPNMAGNIGKMLPDLEGLRLLFDEENIKRFLIKKRFELDAVQTITAPNALDAYINENMEQYQDTRSFNPGQAINYILISRLEELE